MTTYSLMQTFQEMVGKLVKPSHNTTFLKGHPLIVSHYGCQSMKRIVHCIQDLRSHFSTPSDDDHLNDISASFDSLRDGLVYIICQGWKEG